METPNSHKWVHQFPSSTSLAEKRSATRAVRQHYVKLEQVIAVAPPMDNRLASQIIVTFSPIEYAWEQIGRITFGFDASQSRDADDLFTKVLAMSDDELTGLYLASRL